MIFRKNKIDLSRMMPPTSKMTLKMSCLASCNNDVDKAMKLYDFFAKDIAELPDFDIPKPSIFQQVRTGADDLFGWLNSHGEDIMKGWQFLQAIRNGGTIPTPASAMPPADVPPIPQS